MAESKVAARERMRKVITKLKRLYPDAHCSLHYETPFQLMIATILSAQCTDERVNKVTPGLFKKFPDAPDFATAKLRDIEEAVRSTGFYKNKAKSIQEAARSVVEKHQGKVPQEMTDLVQLRGVGRKTANVILGTAFGKSEGVVVDTHVGRISRRMGFTRQKDPVKIEKDLVDLITRKDWTIYSHLLIDHGRAVCTARKARCEDCKLTSFCPKKGV